MQNNNIEDVDYIIVVPGIEFNLNFLYSWTNMINYLNENNYTYRFAISYSPILPQVRNHLVGNSPNDLNNNKTSSIPFMGKIKYKKVIFIDSDIYWTVSDFEKLIKTDKDILSGIYVMSNYTHISVSTDQDKDGLVMMTFNDLDQHIEEFEILNCGLGFMSCSYGVLEKIGYPWFLTLIPGEKDINGNILYNITGEDTFFCNRARDEGFKIFADPFIRVGHIKPWILQIP
jgi:hypothetical protein